MKSICAALVIASAFAATSAIAQKSQDTIRIAVNIPFVGLSPLNLPLDEANFFYSRVYEPLISRDERAGKWIPQLAKSWTRVNPTTLEFELRDDVVFHNGNKFDADDVVATFDYAKDPAVSLPNKDRYTWVKQVEKLGPHKVRIVATEQLAIDLGLIAYRFAMQDKETMDSLSDKAEYGRLSPVGTGVYKAGFIDKNKGVMIERNDQYKGDPAYSRAPAKRVHGIFQPDRQTQIAELLTGGLDVLVNVNPDQAKDLKSKPNIEVQNLPGGSMIYLALDASGTAGNKALMDPRVRRAIFMAINRDALIKFIIPGEGTAERLDVPCFKTTVGCATQKKPPQPDIEGAKKLLAEAGYPNGFDLVYDMYAPLRDVGVAISGDLLKIGVRAAVNPMTIQIYRKKQEELSMQAWTFLSPLDNFPDVSYVFGLWFQGKRAAYFNHDDIVTKAIDDGIRELDPTKRDAIYQTGFDRITDMSYILPISSIPAVYVHNTEIKILDSQRGTTIRNAGDFGFK